jgi:tetratricopeptide (TPR) repeat protein
MIKVLKDRLASFSKDMVRHLREIVLRRESAGEALTAVKEETKHLARNITKPTHSEGHKNAIQYVKRGMTEYNEKNYAAAERLFRQAISADPEYTRGYAYLGNTLYQRGLLTDAAAMWDRVLTLEPDSELADNVRAKLKRTARR